MSTHGKVSSVYTGKVDAGNANRQEMCMRGSLGSVDLVGQIESAHVDRQGMWLQEGKNCVRG